MPITPSRRTVLATGMVVGGTLLAGCRYTDPVIHSERHNTGASSTPLPTPDPDQLAAAADELAVAGHAGWLSTAAEATAAVKAWAASVAVVHAGAAALLKQVDPLATVPRTPEPVTPSSHSDVTSALAALKSSSETLTATHRTRATAATTAPSALLYTSLLITASWHSAPTLAIQARGLQPREFQAMTATEAVAVLIERLHAAIQGYQTGLGVMDESQARTAALTRLGGLTQLRDAQAAQLRADGEQPPPPLPGYQQPLRPTDANSAALLFGLIERGLLDAAAGVAAATDAADRAGHLGVVVAQIAEAKRWPQPMVQWPGWV